MDSQTETFYAFQPLASSRFSSLRQADSSGSFYSLDGCHVHHHIANSTTWSNIPHTCISVLVPIGDSTTRISWTNPRKQSFTIRQPGVGLIPANQRYQINLREHDELIIFYFELEFIRQNNQHILNCSNWVFKEPQFLQQDQLFQIVSQEIKKHFNLLLSAEKNIINIYYCISLLQLLSTHILTNHTQLTIKSNSKANHFDTKISSLLTYIDQNLDQSLKVGVLAKRTGLSGPHFCRIFKKATGVSPYRYILQQRVEQAKRLLKSSDLKLAAIALQCGFYDQSHFILQFRRFTGKTPKDYRSQIRNL